VLERRGPLHGWEAYSVWPFWRSCSPRPGASRPRQRSKSLSPLIRAALMKSRFAEEAGRVSCRRGGSVAGHPLGGVAAEHALGVGGVAQLEEAVEVRV